MRPQALRRLLITAALGAALLTGGQAVAQQATDETGPAGEPGPSAVGERVNPHQVPPRWPGPVQAREIPRLYPVDQATFGQMKAQANAAAAGAAHLPGARRATAPTPKFPTLDLGQGGGWNPPDAAVAVGPTSILVAVNEAFALYTREGTIWGPGAVSFQSFFGTGDSVFDPRAFYDKASGRFVVGAVGANFTRRTSYFALAVSRTDNPANASTGDWCTYKLDAVTGTGGARAWADFPGLGMDGDNLYFTSNQFAFGSNRFQYPRLLIVPKAPAYSCSNVTTTDFRNLKNPDGSTAFTVQPADRPDAAPGQIGMSLVNAIWASGDKLAVRSVGRDATGKLLLSSPRWVGGSYYDLPADAQQPDSTALINTNDTRLLGAVERYGKIYTANTTKAVSGTLSATPNPRASVQWYEFAPGATTATTRVITDPAIAYYFPGVLPGCTTATTTASCSAPFVALQVSGSGLSQPASAFRVRDTNAPAVYGEGVGGYQLGDRYGDYPGLSADPSDARAVWLLGEYAKATNAWGTAVETVTPTTP